ncbi:MAG: hypothetical protein AB1324_02010 [Candidatus Micrarchaeota archaeon]
MIRKRPKLTLVGPESKPSLPAPHFSSDRLASVATLSEARADLLSDENITKGAWELRRLAEKGEDISSVLPSIPPRLRFAIKNKLQAKVYLTDVLLILAKEGADIGPALSVAPACLSDDDFHVRNRMLLALGHCCGFGGDISDFIETVVPYLGDVAPGNREAAVWTLNVYASRGKHEAHHLLMSLGPEGLDDVNSADVRMTCLRVLKG